MHKYMEDRTDEQVPKLYDASFISHTYFATQKMNNFFFYSMLCRELFWNKNVSFIIENLCGNYSFEIVV